MILECLHVYDATPLGRMAAESFSRDDVRAVCVGDDCTGHVTRKIIFYIPVMMENMPWISENILTRLVL